MDQPRSAADPSLVNRLLEVNSCTQEHIPGRVRAGRLTKRGVLQLRIDSHQVYPIEEVEGIKAQLHVDPLRDTCRIFQRKVSVRVPGIEEAVRGLPSSAHTVSDRQPVQPDNSRR
jgi:hypothetical protein